MPDIAKGAHADIVLNPGQMLRVSSSSTATVRNESGTPPTTTTVTANTQDFGPYAALAKLVVTAVGGRARYSMIAPDLRIVVSSTLAPDSNDGRPDGTIWIQTA